MKKLTSITLIFLANFSVFAQVQKDLQTACSNSAQGTVGNFVISYTIGEMLLVDNIKANGLFVTQGIAQPEVSNGVVNYSAFTPGDIIVFPNPTPNQLSIQISILKPGKMNLQLYDAIGKIVLTDVFDINAFITKRYNLDKYTDGTYALRLQFISNDGVMNKRGTYKIIKAN